jgi:hypothetical protein
MATESQPQESYNKPAYGLSSWNYGSFHASNPYYAPPKVPRPNSAAVVDSANRPIQRSQSVNKFGKRKLEPEERIVTEDYLKAMKDVRTIKNSNSQHKKRMNTSHMGRTSGTNNNELSSSCNRRESLNSQGGSQIISKKNLKYQLTFEEWAIMKNKQNEIFKRVQVIKESEDKKFELFNKKIDENYDKVK